MFFVIFFIFKHFPNVGGHARLLDDSSKQNNALIVKGLRENVSKLVMFYLLKMTHFVDFVSDFHRVFRDFLFLQALSGCRRSC